MSAAERLDQIRTEISFAGDLPGTCSSYVLYSFGVVPAEHWSRSMNEIEAELEANGRTVRRMWVSADSMACPTLAQFVRDHQDGEYVLLTGANGPAHTMALRNGRLTDTDLTGTSRRRINMACEVV